MKTETKSDETNAIATAEKMIRKVLQISGQAWNV